MGHPAPGRGPRNRDETAMDGHTARYPAWMLPAVAQSLNRAGWSKMVVLMRAETAALASIRSLSGLSGPPLQMRSTSAAACFSISLGCIASSSVLR